jgi:hypothetical protein
MHHSVKQDDAAHNPPRPKQSMKQTLKQPMKQAIKQSARELARWCRNTAQDQHSKASDLSLVQHVLLSPFCQ